MLGRYWRRCFSKMPSSGAEQFYTGFQQDRCRGGHFFFRSRSAPLRSWISALRVGSLAVAVAVPVSAAVLAVLARRGVTLDRLLTSPYRRALQTAELAVEVGIAPCLERCDLLRPAESPLALVHCLQGRVGLVGHEPDLGQLACSLLGLMPGCLQLKKAGLVLLRRSE